MRLYPLKGKNVSIGLINGRYIDGQITEVDYFAEILEIMSDGKRSHVNINHISIITEK